jgi:hypothetical protein
MNRTVHLNKPKRDIATVDTRDGLPTSGRNVRPQARFAYIVYPKSWDYVEGFGFLPVLRRIVAMPGANGVDRRGSISRAVATAIEKGATYIDPKDGRLGDYTDYVQYYDCDSGAKWYVDFCQKATVLPGGEILWNVDDAVKEMKQFRAHLRNAEIVPAMVYEIYLWLLNREQASHDNLLARSVQNPHLAKRATEAARRLDLMRETWDKMSAAKADTVKSGRGRRPKRKTAEALEG